MPVVNTASKLPSTAYSLNFVNLVKPISIEMDQLVECMRLCEL